MPITTPATTYTIRMDPGRNSVPMALTAPPTKARTGVFMVTPVAQTSPIAPCFGLALPELHVQWLNKVAGT
jgi:hypothetical protein